MGATCLTLPSCAPAGAVASTQVEARFKHRPPYRIRSPERVRRTRRPAAGSLVSPQPVRSDLAEGSGRTRARDDHPGAAVLLEPSHRSQPRLQAAVVGLDVVVGILLSAMPGRRQQLLQQDRIDRCPVGDDLDRRGLGGGDGPLKNRRAALTSRCVETKTSMTWPNWSIGRYT